MAKIDVPGIPYQAAPQVTPQGSAPKLDVRATPGMFGGQVGEAIQGLGRTMEGVGDQMFARAYDFMKLDIDTKVNETANKYLAGGAELNEKFQEQLGENAGQEALKTHNDSLEKMRQEARAALPSDYARKEFDQRTFGTTRQLMIRAGGHAASQMKQLYIHSQQATIDMEMSNLEKAKGPDEEAAAWKRVEEATQNKAKVTGDSDVMTKNQLRIERSKGFAARLYGMIDRGQLDEAKEYFQQNREKMDQVDAGRVTAKMSGKLLTYLNQHGVDNTFLNPEGTGQHPGESPQSSGQLALLPQQLTQPYNVFRKDNGKVKAGVVATDEDRLGYTMMTDNPEADVAKIQAAYGKLNVPATVGVRDGKIHVRLPDEYDLSAPFTPPKELVDSRAGRVADWAAGENTENPAQHESALKASYAKNNQMEAGKKQELYDNLDKIYGALTDPNRPHSVPEMEAYLKGKYGNTAAWDGLPEQTKFRLMELVYKTAPIHSDINVYAKLLGISTFEPERLYSMPDSEIIGNPGLSEAHQRFFLQKKYNAMKAQPVNQAVHQAWAYLQNAIPAIREFDKDDRDLFKGLLQGAVEQELSDAKGKKFDEEAMKKIGASLMYPIVEKGFIWDSTTPLFKSYVSEEERQKAKEDPRFSQLGQAPSDEQADLYVRLERRRKLAEGAAARATAAMTAPPGTPEVGTVTAQQLFGGPKRQSAPVVKTPIGSREELVQRQTEIKAKAAEEAIKREHATQEAGVARKAAGAEKLAADRESVRQANIQRLTARQSQLKALPEAQQSRMVKESLGLIEKQLKDLEKK